MRLQWQLPTLSFDHSPHFATPEHRLLLALTSAPECVYPTFLSSEPMAPPDEKGDKETGNNLLNAFRLQLLPFRSDNK